MVIGDVRLPGPDARALAGAGACALAGTGACALAGAGACALAGTGACVGCLCHALADSVNALAVCV